MSACAECQEPVSTAARKCPHCGAGSPSPERSGTVRSSLIGLGVALFALLVLAVWVQASTGYSLWEMFS
jgi:hypothetical protein